MDDDSEAVLKKIMDDGTFDELRQKLVDHLKKNVRLHNNAPFVSETREMLMS